MAEPSAPAGGPAGAEDESPARAPGRGGRPRTGGDVARLGPVQIALALLVFLFVLLVLWMLWPLITGT